MKYLFPTVIALSALAVSASAAYYSVFGLSKLFAGASTEVIVMAASLEVAKLVVASLLYRYWNQLSIVFKTYLIVACMVLIGITSMGIYGFLSGAYQETANQSNFADKQVQIIEAEKTLYIEQKDDLTARISEFTQALANPDKIQYVDRETGLLVTTSSSRQRNLMMTQLSEAKVEFKTVTDSIMAKELQILNMQINNESARELGPLKYISELTGKSMESVVNILMILLMCVFDPLAVVLVVVANLAFSKARPKVKPAVEPDFDWEAAEKRMDIIGQNGNDGIHYEARIDNIESWLKEHSRKFVGNRNVFSRRNKDAEGK